MINCCVSGVPPAPVYKGVVEGAGQGGWRVQLPPGVGLPLFLLGVGEGRKRKEGGRKGGGRPPSQFGLGLGGHAPSHASFPSFPLSPNNSHIPPGGFR